MKKENLQRIKTEADAISMMFEYLIKHINDAPSTAQLVIQMSKELNGEQIVKAIQNAEEKIEK
jgi:hypothetical protein